MITDHIAQQLADALRMQNDRETASNYADRMKREALAAYDAACREHLVPYMQERNQEMTTIEEYQALVKQQREIIETLMAALKMQTHSPVYPPPAYCPPSLVGPGQWPPQITCGVESKEMKL